MAKFITIEGGEGVGKSTFTKKLVEYLNKKNIDVVATREPGGTEAAQRIREIFVSPPKGEDLHMMTELLLVNAARCQHVENKIRPSLKEDKWVVCDRYVDSTMVYQGALGGVDQSCLKTLTEYATRGLMPDLTFVLHAKAETVFNRIQKRHAETGEEVSRYDAKGLEFQRNLGQAFLEIAKKDVNRVKVIDADQTPDQVFEEALTHLNSLSWL